MKKQLLLFLLSCVAMVNVNSQTTCSTSNTAQTLPDVSPFDTAEHNTGDHHVIFSPRTTCTYIHGTTSTCNTQCSVNQSSLGTVNSETGQLNALGTHMVSFGFNPGSGSATNAGATCTGTLGAAAVNCFTVPFTQTCSLSMTFSGGANGGTFSVSTNGHQVWLSNTPINNNCGAVKDPQNTTTHIPGCQPDCPAHSTTCVPCGASPIVLDLDGNGFNLTDAANGVRFDISGSGNPIQMGWTAAGSNNAFLALPGADGLVHNGQQLFGNFSPQPPSDQPNGFAALAAYDDPNKGGNGDGMIDARDAVFSLLRLWIDANHDGISQPEELHTLPSLGVNSVSLNYKRDDKKDDYGNAFRYRTRVNPEGHTDVGKKAYDIFFVVETDPNIAQNKCIAPKALSQITISSYGQINQRSNSLRSKLTP